jgi:hypothetical protein
MSGFRPAKYHGRRIARSRVGSRGGGRREAASHKIFRPQNSCATARPRRVECRMIPDYRNFPIGSIFTGTGQPPTRSALLTANLVRLIATFRHFTLLSIHLTARSLLPRYIITAIYGNITATYTDFSTTECVDPNQRTGPGPPAVATAASCVASPDAEASARTRVRRLVSTTRPSCCTNVSLFAHFDRFANERSR